ncbi:MAG: DNA polymerase III subunit alpha [Ignavibacteriales bacterium]|nr:DNA polymerase III subunit alpha [Ignavibacteriales bacterium]
MKLLIWDYCINSMLHTHSNYSLLQGAVSIDDLIGRAKSFGMKALALTDRNGMYGLIQFYKKATEEGIKPILGAYIDDPADTKEYVLLLAATREGYSNLCRIITARKLRESFTLDGLVRGELPGLFLVTPSIRLLKAAGKRATVFGELPVTPSTKKLSREVYEFCVANGYRYVPTSPVYFLDKEDYLLHKTVTAIRLRTTLGSIKPEETEPEDFYFRSYEEVMREWKKIPGALQNINYIVDNCNLNLEMGKTKFPLFPTPNNEPSFSYLWKLAFKGLEMRYHTITETAINRLRYELEVINDLGFPDYFLVVWDIVREAKQRGMMLLGRGSAANSLVSYCLGFTEVDPIKYDLYFERFLNRGRMSPPDVDLDFSWRERDEIVKYVFEKYGYDKVAMISTTVTFRARSAFRETAKVFGIAESEISQYSKFIPWTDARNLSNLATMFPEAKSLKFEGEPWKSIITIASRLASFPRHLSIHPGGIVITPTPITDFVALEFASNKGLGIIITQPDMYPVEDMGLIKIDLLSQRSLGVLRETMTNALLNYG